MNKLYIFCSDKRNELLKEMYAKSGDVVENILFANYIICPIPLTKDGINVTGSDMTLEDLIELGINKTVFSGAIPRDIKRRFEMNNVTCYDLMESDEIAYLNAIPTAEGAINIAMESTDFVLHGANVMVIGFGRVGKVLSHKLDGLDTNLFCVARSKKDLALISAMGYNVVDLKNINDYLSKMDVIFSTVPMMILGENRLRLINKDTLIIDLASSPGSVDYEAAKNLGIDARLELGIPTRVAPKSAAKYIKETIDNVINEK